jgi:hypothetical protein
MPVQRTGGASGMRPSTPPIHFVTRAALIAEVKCCPSTPYMKSGFGLSSGIRSPISSRQAFNQKLRLAAIITSLR